jgi:hypothetical protein
MTDCLTESNVSILQTTEQFLHNLHTRTPHTRTPHSHSHIHHSHREYNKRVRSIVEESWMDDASAAEEDVSKEQCREGSIVSTFLISNLQKHNGRPSPLFLLFVLTLPFHDIAWFVSVTVSPYYWSPVSYCQCCLGRLKGFCPFASWVLFSLYLE